MFFSASEDEHQTSTSSTETGPKALCDGQTNPQYPLEEAGGHANADSPQVWSACVCYRAAHDVGSSSRVMAAHGLDVASYNC